ncbi:MAG: hypothetical protein Q8K12_13545 [Thiobacillus sp.]|nr:hypothetical protein [Thiobacillus sp.]
MAFFHAMKNHLQRQMALASAPAVRFAERQLILQAQGVAQSNRGRQRLDGLHEAEFCAFSQWGEDGIIDWLVERLPGIPPTFIEFGVEDYRESNTRLLLQLRNWRGLVMDGSQDHISNIQGQEIYWRHDLTAKCAFIDRDNINNLLADAGLQGEVGLLSVDIDGNDYWVWQAIDVVSPAIVVCEYNAVLGDRYALTVPYQADFQRTRAHHSNLYFGASIRALIALGQRKGYTFVGTTSTGCNAFFVRNDLAPAVVSALDGIWAFPSAVREARDPEGRLLFVSGVARAELIKQQPLVDLERNAQTTLAACHDLYSTEWGGAARTRI